MFRPDRMGFASNHATKRLILSMPRSPVQRQPPDPWRSAQEPTWLLDVTPETNLPGARTQEGSSPRWQFPSTCARGRTASMQSPAVTSEGDLRGAVSGSRTNKMVPKQEVEAAPCCSHNREQHVTGARCHHRSLFTRGWVGKSKSLRQWTLRRCLQASRIHSSQTGARTSTHTHTHYSTPTKSSHSSHQMSHSHQPFHIDTALQKRRQGGRCNA